MTESRTRRERFLCGQESCNFLSRRSCFRGRFCGGYNGSVPAGRSYYVKNGDGQICMPDHRRFLEALQDWGQLVLLPRQVPLWTGVLQPFVEKDDASVVICVADATS
jgi:hypothetical protein